MHLADGLRPALSSLVRVLVTDRHSVQRSCRACWKHGVQTRMPHLRFDGANETRTDSDNVQKNDRSMTS